MKIVEGAEYYRTLGFLALEAERPDLEEAFERLKQAILISDDRRARAELKKLRDRLKKANASRSPRNDDLASHRTRLLQAVEEF
jgi:hypothetical protein